MTSARLTLYAGGVALAMVAGAAWAIVNGAAREVPLGGDYVAFHAAGQMVWEGESDRLYDLDAQVERQTPLLRGWGEGGAVRFVNPPFVAAVYAPLARLPFPIAYALMFALGLLASLGALALIRDVAPIVREAPVASAALTIGFWPLFNATEIGQNTAFSLLAFAALWRGVESRRSGLAGIAAGALLFKPQLALVALAVLVIRRDARAVGVAALVGVGWYLLGAAVSGWAWPIEWLTALSAFAADDARDDLAWGISFWSIHRSLIGVGAPVVGLLASAVGLALLWWARASRGLVPLAAMVAVLSPPHSGFYEAGLCLLAAVWIIETRRAAARWVLTAVWVVGALGYFMDPVWVHPYFLLTLILAVGLARSITPKTITPKNEAGDAQGSSAEGGGDVPR